MDQKIQSYIDSLISQVSSSQNEEYIQKLRDYFNSVVFDTTLNLMTDEQLISLKGMPLSSPQAAQKIEEIASQIPDLAQKLEVRLNQEVEKIKADPSLIK